MEALAQSYQILLILAATIALILLGVIVHRLGRTRVVRPQTSSLRSQPHLETPDGRVLVPLPNLDTGGCVLGRAYDADVRLDAILPCVEGIAARHARIYRDATSGFVIIETLDTAHDIWINGLRAARKNLLKDRWVIELGKCTLIYRDGHPDTGPLR